MENANRASSMEERRSSSSRGDLKDIQYLCALHTTASLLTSACVVITNDSLRILGGGCARGNKRIACDRNVRKLGQQEALRTV
jgi:hypothetical protein